MTPLHIVGLGDAFIIGPTAMVFELESRGTRFYYSIKTKNAVLVDTKPPSISTTSVPLKVGTYLNGPGEAPELDEILDRWHVNKTVKFHLSTGDKITVLGVFK